MEIAFPYRILKIGGPAIRKLSAIVAAGMIAATITIAQQPGAPPPPPPPAGSFNVFVATNGNNSGTNCRRFSPAVTNPDSGGTTVCATLVKACQVAQRGDTVQVASGTYAAEHYTSCNTSGSGQISYSVAQTNGVTIAKTTISCEGGNYGVSWCIEGASNLAFDGFIGTGSLRISETGSSAGSGNISFTHGSTNQILFLGPVHDIFVANSFIGNATFPATGSTAVPAIQRYQDPYNGPSNVTIQDSTFQNIGSNNSGDHTECLHVWGRATNINLLRNKFIFCGKNAQATADINYQSNGGLIENNFFDNNNTYAVLIGCTGGSAGGNDTIFQYNSLRGPYYYGDPSCAVGNGDIVRGNYMPWNTQECLANVTLRYNVYQSSSGTSVCSGTGNIGVTTLDFADASAMNLHLTSSANALGRGDPSSCTALDIDGETRPINGSTCDAGADER